MREFLVEDYHLRLGHGGIMNTRRALVSILLTAIAASIAIASLSVMQIKPPANEPKIINPGPRAGRLRTRSFCSMGKTFRNGEVRGRQAVKQNGS